MGMVDNLNLLTAAETAEVLNISLRTFMRWRAEGKGPVGKLIGKSVWWSRGDIAEWWDSQPTECQKLNPALR